MDLPLGRIVIGTFLLLSVQVLLSGAVGLPVQIVHQRIESVNGSNTTMGCTSLPLSVTDRNTTCGSPGNGAISFLIDGCSPDIDTSTSDWASQLVTVRRNEGTAGIDFAHVLLTFGFDTAVSLTGIEMDLFNCPDWNIGTSSTIAVYLNPDYNLVATTNMLNSLAFVFGNVDSLQSSCDSLSTVTFSGGVFQSGSYRTVHILVDLSPPLFIQEVYVGEVRFMDSSGIPLNFSSSTNACPSSIQTSATSSKSPVIVHSSSDFTTSASTTVTPVTSPPPSATDPSSSGGTDSTVLIVIAAVIAVIVVALLVVLIVIIVVVKKRQSQAKVKEVQDIVREGGGGGGEEGEVELKRMESKQDEYTANNPLYNVSTSANGQEAPAASEGNGGYLVANNPHYYTMPIDPAPPGTEVDDGLYTVVDDEKKSTLKQAAVSVADNRLYASVSETQSKSPSPAPKDSGPIYAMVDKTKRPTGEKNAPPAVSNGVFTDEDPFNSPAIPPKSTDLQAYLSTQEAVSHPLPFPTSSPNKPHKVSALPESLAVGMSSNPNYESTDALSHASHDADSDMYAVPDVNTALATTTTTTSNDDGDIYSEPIQPSDFTRGGAKQKLEKAGGEEDDGREGPRVYSSIYTMAATKEKVQLPLEFNSGNIKELKELGTGQFGKVVLAQTIGLSLKDLRISSHPDRNISIYVAVKKLRSKANSTEREAFDKEIKFMSRLSHPNVVRFLGVCYQDPAFIIMEYMEQGDLSLFLQRYSEIVDIPTDTTQIAMPSIINMALQIASGMKYLASENFVHRDLASRNCLVDDKFTVKLADFGMSRNLYESHYYKIKGNAILPIRWMATECYYGMFSEKTDVWAFGITMWELFTLAKDKPYPHLNDSEVVEDAVNKGVNRYIHPKPPACPQPVYDVMLCCWVTDRKKRATFEALHEMLLRV